MQVEGQADFINLGKKKLTSKDIFSFSVVLF